MLQTCYNKWLREVNLACPKEKHNIAIIHHGDRKMSVKATHTDSRLVIKVSGKMAASVQKEFRNAYKDLEGITEYIIDFADTDYADSSGLGLLLVLYGVAKNKPGPPKLKIIHSKPAVKDLLLLSKFNRFYEIG